MTARSPLAGTPLGSREDEMAGKGSGKSGGGGKGGSGRRTYGGQKPIRPVQQAPVQKGLRPGSSGGKKGSGSGSGGSKKGKRTARRQSSTRRRRRPDVLQLHR